MLKTTDQVGGFYCRPILSRRELLQSRVGGKQIEQSSVRQVSRQRSAFKSSGDGSLRACFITHSLSIPETSQHIIPFLQNRNTRQYKQLPCIRLEAYTRS